jgi:two-component system alkaline phosphatase synthesis response regulator PhoP
MAESILIVEDERNVGSTLAERLAKEGFEVAWATSARDARSELAKRRFELLLLDVGLPDGTGFEIAELVKKTQPSVAIVFLTAFSAPEHRIRGLELGAEDYITKPFHLKELLLRLKNALRRARYLSTSSGLEDPDGGSAIGIARVFFSRFEAEVGGKTVSLTHKEAALLKLLLERRGRVVSRDEILNRVWSEDEFPTSRTVDNFIMRLRRLVEADPENPLAIRSVRGVGYLLS